MAGSGGSAPAVLPIRPQFVVAAPFFRIPQDFVSFVDLLEFRLSGSLVFGHVGVMHPRELAERLLDLLRRGAARHAQRFVVILKFHGHDAASASMPVILAASDWFATPARRRSRLAGSETPWNLVPDSDTIRALLPRGRM